MDNKLLHFQADFKAVADASDDGGVRIQGYASTKDQDRGDDVVDPKAFEESIRTTYKDNPMILFQHNRNEPIGKATSMNVDSKGLFIEAIIYDEKVAKLVQKGVLKTFSIGYLPKEVEYRDKNDEIVDPSEQTGRLRIWTEEGIKRIIKKLELLEVSIVTLPMNASALFSLAKSLDTYFEAEKAEFLSSNPNVMAQKDTKNLLETKEEESTESTEEAAEETSADEGGAEETEESTTEDTSEEDESESTEEAENEEGEKPSASEDETEEADDGEKTDESDGDETSTEEEESEEDAEESEEDESTEDEEEDDGEKSVKLDEKLCTKENLDLALKTIVGLKTEVAELKEQLDKLPTKKASIYQDHKLRSASDIAKKAVEKKDNPDKKGFKAALEGAAGN